MNEQNIFDRIMLGIRITVSVAISFCAVLQLAGVWDKALNVAIPLLSIVILIQAIQEHREQRKLSAIISFVCFALMIVMVFGAYM